MMQVGYAIYRCFDADDRLLYIGMTKNLGQRLAYLSSEQPWFKREVAKVDHEIIEDVDVAAKREVELITTLRPAYNNLRQGPYARHKRGQPRKPKESTEGSH